MRATWAVPSLVLGFRLPIRIRGPGEVHFLFRVLLASVLLPLSSTVSFAGGVPPIGVGGPRGARPLLALRPRYL